MRHVAKSHGVLERMSSMLVVCQAASSPCFLVHGLLSHPWQVAVCEQGLHYRTTKDMATKRYDACLDDCD